MRSRAPSSPDAAPEIELELEIEIEIESTPAPRSGELGRDRWFFLAGLGAFAICLAFRRLGDFDLPWHLATGRFITELKRIPRADPLSFTHAPLTYVEPLTDVPLYWLWQVSGAAGLQCAGALCGGALGAILFWQLRNLGPIAYAASALCLAGMYAWIVVRPATLSFVLLALVLGIIETHRRLARDGRGRSILLAFPAGILLWTNAHGFAPMGAGLLFCYALYRIACKLARGRAGSLLPGDDAKAALATLLAALAALAAATLNVAGVTLRLGPSRLGSDAISAYAFSAITEFAPTTLRFLLTTKPIAALIGVVGLLSLVIGRSGRDGSRVPTAYDIGCVGIGWVALLWMVRTVPVGMLVMLPVIARRMAGLIPATPIARWGLASGGWLAAGVALVQVDTGLGVGFEPTHFPERAVAFLEQEAPQGHLWNFSPFGGYLSWRLYPRMLTFMDGRNSQAHEISHVLSSWAALHDRHAFDALMRDIDAEIAIMSAKEGESFGRPLAQSPHWTMVELDDVAAVYVRTEGRNAPLARRGYRILRHLTALSEVLQVAASGGELAPMLQNDGRLAAAQAPTSSRSAFLAACGELAMRDFAAFELALHHLAVLAPDHPSIDVLRQLRTRLDVTR